MLIPSRTNRRIVIAAMVIFAALLPIFLITSNVRLIINSDWLYEYNWWRNSIPERSGIPESELDRAAGQIVQYFNDDAEYLDVRVRLGGIDHSLYNQREVLHMKDVKDLVQGTFVTSTMTGLLLLILAAIGLWLQGRQFWGYLAQAVKWSAIGSIGVIVLIGVATAIDFNAIFTLFHFISFANDLWRLNPQTDYLIIMFPERFFMEATLMIAAMTVAEFALLFLAAVLMRGRYSVQRR